MIDKGADHAAEQLRRALRGTRGARTAKLLFVRSQVTMTPADVSEKANHPAAARGLSAAPGEWELEQHEDDTLGDDEPFWLLELVGGAVEASQLGSGHVRGEPCAHYQARASLSLASQRSARLLGPRGPRSVQVRSAVESCSRCEGKGLNPLWC